MSYHLLQCYKEVRQLKPYESTLIFRTHKNLECMVYHFGSKIFGFCHSPTNFPAHFHSLLHALMPRISTGGGGLTKASFFLGTCEFSHPTTFRGSLVNSALIFRSQNKLPLPLLYSESLGVVGVGIFSHLRLPCGHFYFSIGKAHRNHVPMSHRLFSAFIMLSARFSLRLTTEFAKLAHLPIEEYTFQNKVR